jgi:HD superfamily phosphodiesterase
LFIDKLTSPITHKPEKVLKQELEDFFSRHYPAEILPSHGLDHHRRVWGYARELLQYSESYKFSFDRTFIHKLMIACYLHDIGIAIDPGIKHGHYSCEICKKFLEEQKLQESDYQDLLSAIENHDDKEYRGSDNQNLLLIILSVADDLDAFGETGISRYLEIYRVRGIEKEKMDKAVCDNAEKRFRNFENHFVKYPSLVEKHRERYNELINYFSDV